MLALTILFVSLLFAGVAQAQADLSCIVTPKGYSKMIFGKRMAKDMRIWTCVIHNKGTEPLVVSRASALRVMIDADVFGYSDEAVRIYYNESTRLGMPKTIGRVLNQIVRVGGIIMGSGLIEVGKTLQFITVVGGPALPDIGNAISARAPTLENFERLAGSGDIGVAGESDAEFVMFSGAVEDGRTKVTGVINGVAGVVSTFGSIPDGALEFTMPPFNSDPFPVDPSLPPPSFAPTASVPQSGFKVWRTSSTSFDRSDRGDWEWDSVISHDSELLVKGVGWLTRDDFAPVYELAVDPVTEAALEMRLHSKGQNDWASPDHLSLYGSL